MSNINDEINNIVLDADNVSSFDSDNEIEFVMAEKARRAFATITSFLIDSRKDVSDKDKKTLQELLRSPSMLSIKSYKCYLRYKAEIAWENHQNANLDSYQNLSYKIMDYLKYYTAEEAIKIFSEDLKEVSMITKKDIDYIKSLIIKYKNAYLRDDIIALSEASSNIKSLVKEYNGKAKEYYIKTYIEANIDDIKKYFTCTQKNSRIADNETEEILDMLIGNSKIRNGIRTLVYKDFGVLLETEEIEELISNVIYNNEVDNYKKLRISTGYDMNLLNATRSFNRLNANFLDKFNKHFNVEQIDLLNQFLHEDDKDKLKELYSQFSNGDLRLLHTIRPIFKEANAVLSVEDDKFKFVSDRVLDSIEQREYKSIYKENEKYQRLHNTIYKYFYASAQYLDKIEEDSLDGSVLFTDDNYELINYSYLTNFEVYEKFIKGISADAINNLTYDDNSLIKLKKLLIDEGLIACFICGGEDISLLSDIVNNYQTIFKGNLLDDCTINRLSCIIKKAELGRYLDDFTLALVGEEVAEKIVYNFQFLQGKNTPESILLRLKKADDLMVRAELVNKSAIPYFDPITYDNVTLNRYNNNDSKVLTSGIDSNTCFKICANDNDYLFYSLLNKNGMVVYFNENGKMCGRFTAHTRNNCLLINGLRSIECDYGINSLEQRQREDKIVELVKVFGNKIIELTTDSNCPIDFVVVNKSGILESNRYDNNFEMVDEQLFSQFVDTYNDDFEEFRHLYDGKEQLLQEVPYYRSGCKQPFTTDFGHYPLLMITKREGKNLNRMWDISTDTPDAVYERKPKKTICGKNRRLTPDELVRVRKIHALDYYYSGGDPKDYIIPSYFKFAFEYIEIKEDEYTLVTSEHIFTCKYSDHTSNYQYKK